MNLGINKVDGGLMLSFFIYLTRRAKLLKNYILGDISMRANKVNDKL